jgi:hypothetical protein
MSIAERVGMKRSHCEARAAANVSSSRLCAEHASTRQRPPQAAESPHLQRAAR